MSGRSERAALVKKIMTERGVKLGEASKLVKAEGLYTPKPKEAAAPVAKAPAVPKAAKAAKAPAPATPAVPSSDEVMVSASPVVTKVRRVKKTKATE